MGAVTTTFVDNVRERPWRAFDWQLLLYVGLIVGFGVVMGYSASFNEAGQAAGGISQSVKTLLWVGIGFTIFFVAASIDYHWLTTFTAPIYIGVLGLLVLNLVIGRSLNGASCWKSRLRRPAKTQSSSLRAGRIPSLAARAGRGLPSWGT